MPFCNVVNATPNQIEKITKKYVPGFFKRVRVTYGDDNVYIIAVTAATYIYEFQVRRGDPCFFGLKKGETRYDIPYPTGELLRKLKKLSDKEIKKWKGGNHL